MSTAVDIDSSSDESDDDDTEVNITNHNFDDEESDNFSSLMTTDSSDSSSTSGHPRRKNAETRKARRDALFKKFYDYDRYDTESYDDEVPLKKPHVKKTPYVYGVHLNLPWLYETEEEEMLRKTKEIAFGENSENRSSQLPLDNFFINKWIEKYLGGPIKTWKPITSARDKVEIEPLDCDLFPSLKPYKAILVEINDPGGKVIKVQRVCGYREIMKKRARVKELKWNAKEDKRGHNAVTFIPVSTDVTCNEEKLRKKREFKKSIDIGKQSKPKVYKKTCGKEKMETITLPKLNTILPDGHIFKEEIGDGDFSKINYNEIEVGGSDSSSSDSVDMVIGKESMRVRIPIEVMAVGGGDNTTASRVNVNAPETLSPNTSTPEVRQSTSVPAASALKSKVSVNSDVYDDGMDIYDDDDRDLDIDAALQKEDSKLSIDFKLKEKDNEWLNLTSSDSQEIFNRFENLAKPNQPWMREGTGYESQHLAKTLRGFMCAMCLIGRLPFGVKSDELVGLVLYTVDLFRGFPFFLTSTSLWIIFVVSIQALLDIMYTKQDAVFEKVEVTELEKYKSALMLIFVNLSFTSLWSMAMMLKDNYHICQFMNFITASLTKMEISGTRHIKKTVVNNFFIGVAYCAIISTSFYYDQPKTTRGSLGFFAMLICRPFIDQVRLSAHHNMFKYQLGGLIVHLFSYICARVVFTFMHVIAVVIGNLAKNWNFRFGLCFAQFGAKERAHLYRLRLGESLGKIFSHHRLVTCLTRMYGSIFAIPLIIYYCFQILVLSTIVVVVFFQWYTAEQQVTIVEIPYTDTNITMNTYFDNVATSSFVIVIFLIEFVIVSESITSACGAVMDGFEFVRRQGLLRCNNTHERRLVMSLQWSLSAKNPAIINVNNFFQVSRSAVLATIGFSIIIISLVIQLKQSDLVTLVLKCTTNVTRATYRDTCYEIKSVSDTDVRRLQLENRQQLRQLRRNRAP